MHPCLGSVADFEVNEVGFPGGSSRSGPVRRNRASDDGGFAVASGLRWSKGLPLPDRCFIARKVKPDAAQVKRRKLAAGIGQSKLTGSCVQL